METNNLAPRHLPVAKKIQSLLHCVRWSRIATPDELGFVWGKKRMHKSTREIRIDDYVYIYTYIIYMYSRVSVYVFVFIDICVYIPVNLCIDIFTHHERTWKTPKNWENSRYILLLTTLLVPETQDMPWHDSIWHMSRNLCQLGSVEPRFEPRPKNLSLDFLSDSVCMHPGVGRLSTISGIVQFHILSNSGWLYKQIGGYTTIFAMISQPTPPPAKVPPPK